MGMDYTYGLMEDNIKDRMSMIRRMDWESILGRMGDTMKDNGFVESNMARGNMC